jgi:hypothetical protein
MVYATAGSALAAARDDTVAILRCLTTGGNLDNLMSVCVRFAGVVDGPWLGSAARGRIYEYSVLCSELVARAAKIDAEFLLSNGYFLQGSQIPEIEKAIADEPSRLCLLDKEIFGN